MESLIIYARENPLMAVLASAVGIATTSWILRKASPASKQETALDAEKFREFPLIEKRVISHNTAVYRFALASPDAELGLPIGQHISVQATIGDKKIMRSYTPVSSNDDCGYFDLLVKSYPTGNVSKMFAELTLGDKINVRGPKGAFKYRPNLVKQLGMIAGGTGITPMLQVIRAILKNPADTTEIRLIFANVNEEDILLRSELDQLAAEHKQFSVHYVLNNAPEHWTGGVGFVTEDIIREHCPAPSDDVKILLCGPPPMTKAMTTCCEQLGYGRANVVSNMRDSVFKF